MSGFEQLDGRTVYTLTPKKLSRWHSMDCRCGGSFDAIVIAHLKPAGIQRVPMRYEGALACWWEGLAEPTPEGGYAAVQEMTAPLFHALRTPATDDAIDGDTE